MKKLLSVILLSASLLALAACGGVSQEEYDKLAAELETANNQITEITEAYNQLQEEYNSLISNQPAGDVDSGFISALCEGLKQRSNLSHNLSPFVDKGSLINAELPLIDKYYDEIFQNAEIGELARDYIDGVREQKSSIQATSIHASNFEWNEGALKRYWALRDLYKIDESFFSDLPTFYEDYIYIIPECEEAINATKYLDDTMAEIVSTEPSPGEHGDYYFVFPNNSEYKYSIMLKVTYYDENDIRIGERDFPTGNILPGETVQLSFFNDYGNTARMEYDWEVYYTNN